MAAAARPWYRSLVRTLTPRPTRLSAIPAPGPTRLRVEVDGEALVDLDQPVESLSLAPATGGLAELEVHPLSVGAEARPCGPPDARSRSPAPTSTTGPTRR